MNVGTEMFLEVYGRQKLMVQTECHQAVFQNIEAATGNERRPIDDRRYDGTSSCSVKTTVDADDQ